MDISPYFVEKFVYLLALISWWMFLRTFSGAMAYHLTKGTAYAKQKVDVARTICILLIVVTVLIASIVLPNGV